MPAPMTNLIAPDRTTDRLVTLTHHDPLLRRSLELSVELASRCGELLDVPEPVAVLSYTVHPGPLSVRLPSPGLTLDPAMAASLLAAFKARVARDPGLRRWLVGEAFKSWCPGAE